MRLCSLLLLVACTDPQDSDLPDPDTGVPDTDTGVVDTDDTDPVDTDTGDTDTGDTDTGDTDTGDTDTDTGPDWTVEPCEPVDPPQRWSLGEPSVLQPSAAGMPPALTEVVAVDLLGTGGAEILVSDAFADTVTWHGRCDASGCDSASLDAPWVEPTRARVADLDDDGNADVIVADIGLLFPTTDPVGSVRVLWGDGAGGFTHEEVARFLSRTTCAEPADLDGDGDLDLAVCEFGSDFGGRLLWLEQTPLGWTEHELIDLDGTIDAWPLDVTGDGRLDLVASISNMHETVMVWAGDGAGGFTRIDDAYAASDTYWGMAGLRPGDLDRDGDPDFVLTNGDTLDIDLPPTLHPGNHYGVGWLENDGTGRFTYRDLERHWGAYTPRVLDVDGDCDADIVVASFQDDFLFPVHVERDPGFLETLDPDPLFWLEQTPSGWVHHRIEGVALPMLFTLEVVDLDGDGALDVLTGPTDALPVDPDAPALQWFRGALEDR